MAKPKTELEKRYPSPPYTRWDRRGKPVLLCYLKHIDGKSLCLSLQTADPDIAKRHMRLLVAWLLYKERLSPDSGAAKLHGPKGSERSRLKKVSAEVRRLKALPEAAYGSEALAIAKLWACPVGIIHYMAGRKPAVSAGTFNTRRMRRRDRGEQLPKGDTWEHRPHGGKYFGWNGKVLTARFQIGGRPRQWPLKVRSQEQAWARMAPVRVARERLRRAAIEALDCELGTIAADNAALELANARARLARAIVSAGGPEELADFVRKGPQEGVGKTEVSADGKYADSLKPLIEDKSPTARATNGTRAAAPRRHAKSSPALERARGAIKELYPEGVPEQAAEPNANLCRRRAKADGPAWPLRNHDLESCRTPQITQIRHMP
jgi:hypothetical protein